MLRVVVAEDEAIIRLDLVEMLTELGYDVVGQARDGEQAVEVVRSTTPDVALFDVKMPRADGISAAETVIAERLCPVVILTAFSDRSLVARATDAGVLSYLVKPIGPTDVMPAIEVAVARWEQMRALESDVMDLSEQIQARKVIERAKGHLMTSLGMSEAHAFRWLQKRAMDGRTTLRDVAEAVLSGTSTE